MTKITKQKSSRARSSIRRMALCSAAAAPFMLGLAAAPAHAQLVNTATVTGSPDSGTLPPEEAVESVTVALPIDAVNDNVNNVNSTTGGDAVLNVLTGDTLDGNAASTGNVTISEVTPATPIDGGTVPVLNTTTGDVDVPAGTPAGVYTITYEICETANSGNCDTATATITVIDSQISADADAVAGIDGLAGQDDVLDVIDGDLLNNAQTDLTEVDITVTAVAQPVDPVNNPGNTTVPVLNPSTGQVSVPAGTPAGVYTIDYEICESANPDNCADNTATITVVTPVISADDETVTGINSADGANDVVNVLDGDLLGTDPATVGTGGNVTLTVTDPADPLTPGDPVPVLDPATGLVDVPPNTPPGTYTILYQICDVINPTICDDATVTITVVATPIVAVDDATTVSGPDGLAGIDDVLNVFGDDTVNGNAAGTGNATLSVATGSTVPSQLTFNPADGSIDVNPGTLAGDYSFDYEICESVNTDNCMVATATVTVAAAPLLEMTKVADDDTLVVVGQVITYTYTVTNIGNVIVRDIEVSDSHNGDGAPPTPGDEALTNDGGAATGDSTDGGTDGVWDVLAPGDTITFTGTYTVLQADIDNLQ